MGDPEVSAWHLSANSQGPPAPEDSPSPGTRAFPHSLSEQCRWLAEGWEGGTMWLEGLQLSGLLSCVSLTHDPSTFRCSSFQAKCWARGLNVSHSTFSLYITLRSFPSHTALQPNRTYPPCNHRLELHIQPPPRLVVCGECKTAGKVGNSLLSALLPT